MAKTYEVKIDDTVIANLKGYDVEREKRYVDKDTNIAGDVKSIYIGEFATLTLEFGYLTETELSALLGVLEGSILAVEWWDTREQAYRLSNYFYDSFKYPYFLKHREMYAPFTLVLKPYNKLSDDQIQEEEPISA